MKKLLLTGAFKYTEEQLDFLNGLGYSITFIQDERKKIDIDVSEFEAVVCNNLFIHNDITKFKSLKFIQVTSAGLDRIPLNYITKNGIKLFSAKGVYSIPMAEWAILKTLEIYKKSRSFYSKQNKRDWSKERELLELTDKKVAIVGFGSVGLEIAKRFKVFGTFIISIDVKDIKSAYTDQHVLISDLNYALKNSDIVILTLPLTNETRYILNKEKIELMKDQALMINLARGELIDEVALINALEEGKFLGVALDVFENEPLHKDNALWSFDNVIVTPHNSFTSEKVNERLIRLIINNLKEFNNRGV